MTAQIVYDRFASIAAAARKRAQDVVATTITDGAANVRDESPVETGHMKSTVHGEMTGDLEGEITVGADYGGDVNYGTVHMAPNPFFDRGIEAVRRPFEREAGGVIEG